jgi:hypothetical protein
MTVVVVRHTTAGTTPNNAAGPGSRSFVAAAAARSDAAGWVARQVSQAAIVACDPAMCSALAARGFPTGSLLVLGSSAANPLNSAVVIATPAVRSQFDSRLTSEYAPIAIASFGSGTARVDVLVTAANGAVAYRNALYGDLRARQEAGAQLLRNARITCSPRACAALATGQVDVRLLITFAALAAQDHLDILGFGGGGPGASAGVPLRTAMVASPAGRPGFLRSALALLHAQRAPYLASSITPVRLASGITALRIGYSAPSPLGLLGGQATAAHARPSGHQQFRRHRKH